MIGQISSRVLQGLPSSPSTSRRRRSAAFGYELGSDARFLSFGYWDSLKKGLMAAEALLHDIKRMEAAYLEQNKREYELTKHVSLAQLDPLALVAAEATPASASSRCPRRCSTSTHPGHYLRRDQVGEPVDPVRRRARTPR